MENKFFDNSNEKRILTVVTLSKTDLLIGEVLTANQAAVVQNAVFELNHYLPDVLGMALGWQIRVALLDMDAFSQTGRDFIKKLNTIKKQIKNGRWNLPLKV